MGGWVSGRLAEGAEVGAGWGRGVEKPRYDLWSCQAGGDVMVRGCEAREQGAPLVHWMTCKVGGERCFFVG